MTFSLHPNLSKKIYITELPLCKVLLEDNRNYPWLFLVPCRENIGKIMDLNAADQLQLIKELDYAQKILWSAFKPTQINVAAIGNKTPQLHIHIIARNISDPAWPGTVWDHPSSHPYSMEEKEVVTQRLVDLFKAF